MLATVTVKTTKGYIRAAARDGTLYHLYISVTKTRTGHDYKHVPHTKVREWLE